LFAESAHEFLRIYGTNAPDHSRREVFLDTIGRSRRRRAEKPRSELLTVGAVVDPFARGSDPLAGRNGCRMADHGHHIAMPARLDAQNAEAVFAVMVGNALDEAGQHFLRRWLRLRLHIDGVRARRGFEA